MFQYGGGHVFKPFSSTAVSIPKNFLLSAKKRKSLSLSAKAPSNNSTSQRDELLKEIFGAPNRSSSSPSLLLDYAREKKASQEYKENIAMEHEEVHNTPTNKDIESSQPISAHNLQHKHVMDKVMRDYNSPSATARVRAVKALNSATFRKAHYEIFDLPHEEQDLITEEERNAPLPVVKTIQEVMAQVKIFVEVRSGSDNRSEAIKKKIYETGAEIHDKIYRDTTHVVFREGLQSVYNKAKMMKIPVVNLLWIEDCKKYRKVVDPSKYTISDLDRYENPDMYKKIRRQKSMQPDYKFDYISNKLVYKSDKRASIGKYKTPSATAMTSSEESLNNLIGDNEKETLDSASKVTIQETFDVIDASSQSSVCDSLDEYVKMAAPKPKTTAQVVKPATPNSTRRRTMFHTSTIQSSVIDEETENNDKTKEIKVSKTETPQATGRCTRRQTNLFTPQPMEVSKIDTPSTAGKNNKRRSNLFTPQQKEASSVSMDISKAVTPLTPYQGATTRRRSNIFTPQLVKSTPVINAPTPGTSTGAYPKISNQTLLTPRAMDISVASLTKKISQADLTDKSDMAVVSNSRPSRRSLFTHSSMQYQKDESKSSQPEKSKEADKTVLQPQLMQLTLNSTQLTRQEKSRRSMDVISMQIGKLNEKITQKENPWIAKKVGDVGSAKKGGEQIVVQAIVHREDPHSQPISTQVNENPPVIKKRKLFTLDDEEIMVMTPPVKKPAVSRAPKRQSIAAIQISSIAEKKAKMTGKTPVGKKDFQSRRTAMFFETPDAMIKRKLAIKSASKPTAPTAPVKAQKLVFTNMHSEEIAVIKEAISKLGRFEIEDNVSDQTSHLVTLNNNRTMNILRGIIRGLWIVSFDWIKASLAAEKWVYEEPFEFLECSPVLQRLRSEKKTLGSSYKNDLFLSLPAFYISADSVKNVKVKNLKELIKSCRGKLADSAQYSKFIITEKYLAESSSLPTCNVNQEKIVQLHPNFLLDSICQNRILPYKRYSVKVKEAKKENEAMDSEPLVSQPVLSQLDLASQIM